MLHGNSGQLLLYVRATDPEERCAFGALVYTSAAMNRFFPSHSAPLPQPLSHSVGLDKDFSVARAHAPAVFPSPCALLFAISISLFLLPFPLCLPCFDCLCHGQELFLSASLRVTRPPIPTWHMVSKLVCKYLSWMQSTTTCQLPLSLVVTSLLGQMAGGVFHEREGCACVCVWWTVLA